MSNRTKKLLRESTEFCADKNIKRREENAKAEG